MDFKINKIHQTRKGITLIELLIYMSVFSILLTGFLSATIYIQNIIQQQIVIFKTKECIYTNLNILQQYLNIAESIEIKDKSIKFRLNKNSVEFKLNYTGNFQILYSYMEGEKIISQCATIKFSNILFTMNENLRTVSDRNDIYVRIEFMDMKKNTISIQEYTTTPNLAPITIF